MASREPIILVFGDLTFPVRPLTINQVEALERTMSATAGTASIGVGVGTAIIAAALSRDHADVDVGAIEAPLSEIATAVSVILRHGGFVTASPGEPQAAA